MAESYILNKLSASGGELQSPEGQDRAGNGDVRGSLCRPSTLRLETVLGSDGFKYVSDLNPYALIICADDVEA